MKAIVTGGAGFLGRSLVGLLAEEGWTVTVLDDFSTGKREPAPSPKVSILEYDVTSTKNLESLFKGTDAVFHLAAVPRWFGESMPLHCLNVNGAGTLRVLLAAKETRVPRFAHVSSGSVNVGRDAGMDDPFGPRSLYGLSKAVGEMYAEFFRGDLAMSILRPFHLYGAGLDPAGQNVFIRFILAALEDGPLTVYGDGEQRLSVTWVGDAARACLWALDRPGRYTVAGETVSVNDLADLVIDLAGGGRKEHVDMPDWAYGDHTGKDDGLLEGGFVYEGRLEEKLPEAVDWLRGITL